MGINLSPQSAADGPAPSFPASDFRASDGGGLNLDLTGGTIRMIGSTGYTFTTHAPQTIVLTDNTTNYIQAGATSIFNNTTAFFNSSIPVVEVVTAGGVIVTITDRYMLGHQSNSTYFKTQTAFPQAIWGLANATVLGFLDMERGPLQMQGLFGAGADENVTFGGASSALNQIELPDGTAALPPFCFIGDNTSGMFWSASGLGFSFGGAEILRAVDPALADEVGIVVLRNTAGVKTLAGMVQGPVDSAIPGFRLAMIPN
jgi:hypothetical protein